MMRCKEPGRLKQENFTLYQPSFNSVSFSLGETVPKRYSYVQDPSLRLHSASDQDQKLN